MQGKPYKGGRDGRMLWNCVDVRDVARAHRLCIETTVGSNGSRYILAASDRNGELFTWQLQALLSSMFPFVSQVGGEEQTPAREGQGEVRLRPERTADQAAAAGVRLRVRDRRVVTVHLQAR